MTRAPLAEHPPPPPHRHPLELRWEPQEERVVNILVCDDERSICELLDIALRRDGHKVETVTGGELAKRKIDSARFERTVHLTKMPGVDGVEVLRHAHQISPESAVILMTADVYCHGAPPVSQMAARSLYIRKSPGLVDEV